MRKNHFYLALLSFTLIYPAGLYAEVSVLPGAAYPEQDSMIQPPVEIKEGWHEIKTPHFILSYQRKDSLLAGEVLEKAESYYRSIARLIGYSGLDSVWLWDKRCRIILYGSREDYLAATQRPEWSSGFAVIEAREIYSYEGAADFLEGVLPHELTHLLFRDFLTANGKVPLWLEEGTAMAQETKEKKEFDAFLRGMADSRRWIPMEDFFRIYSLEGLPHDRVAVFYVQSYSVVRFLIEKFGSSRFVLLCRNLRGGMNLEEALKKNYPMDFPTLEAFENQWSAAIRGK